jgi:adenylate cyclase class IV
VEQRCCINEDIMKELELNFVKTIVESSVKEKLKYLGHLHTDEYAQTDVFLSCHCNPFKDNISTINLTHD